MHNLTRLSGIINKEEIQWNMNYNTENHNEVFLGDYFTKEDAEQTIKEWCDECESPSANNPKNYIIKPYEE